jgi:transglutaminase-like putative cysteine protease
MNGSAAAAGGVGEEESPIPSAAPSGGGVSPRAPDRPLLPDHFPPAVAMNRSRLQVVHMANYRYLVPATRVRTELRLVPPTLHGFQRLLAHKIQVAPLPHTMPWRQDAFGNEIVEAHHEKVAEFLTFAVEITVETRCCFTETGLPLPTPIAPRPGETAEQYREVTWRTMPDASLEAAARDMEKTADPDRDALRFFAALGDRVHREMVFESGSTGVETRAAEAWANRRGVCQDFSHVTLTLCRLCGIPARYVSGFVPGEGVMHAWVEALLPLGAGADAAHYWFAYDPTYNKWVDENYVAVAVGRDYSDISPTSGTYYGGGSTLSYRNRVTRLEREVILL